MYLTQYSQIRLEIKNVHIFEKSSLEALQNIYYEGVYEKLSKCIQSISPYILHCIVLHI